MGSQRNILDPQRCSSWLIVLTLVDESDISERIIYQCDGHVSRLLIRTTCPKYEIIGWDISSSTGQLNAECKREARSHLRMSPPSLLEGLYGIAPTGGADNAVTGP